MSTAAPSAPIDLTQTIGRAFSETRTAWRIVCAVTALYAAAFFAWYPNAFTNYDEGMYIRQGILMADLRSSVQKIDPRTGESIDHYPSTYVIGPALMMAPFVKLFGWRGSFMAPLLGLTLGTLATARLLQIAGYSPLFALLALGFVPSLVMGRVAMSDAPSLLVVAAGLLLFWRGIDGRFTWWLASGFVAGASLIFRATNVLPFAPFFAGAVLRREWKWWALLVGGLAGCSLRLLTNQLAFGDPFFERDEYLFSPETIGQRLPLYLLGLLVLVPGGLAAAFDYRGKRRPELVLAVVLFFLFYLLQAYSTHWSSGAKRLVLALRYFIPLLPLLCLAVAEAGPRRWSALRVRLPGWAASAAAFAVAVWITGVAISSIAVHWTLDRWGSGQAAMRAAFQEVAGGDAVLVTNWGATRKFLPELDRRYLAVDINETTPEQIASMVESYGELVIAIILRDDSALWREEQRSLMRFIEAIGLPLVKESDRQMTAAERMVVWRVRARRREVDLGSSVRAREP